MTDKSETENPERSTGVAAPSGGSASDSRANARVKAIKEIHRLCGEALDHDTSWPLFCELARNRLEIETALMPTGD